MKSDGLKYSVAKNLLWKYGERITAQLVSLIITIILARLLSPKDYGAVALSMVFITIANVFVSNGFGSALIQKEKPDSLDFSTVFYVSLVISISIYLIIFVSAPLIAKFYDLQIISPVLRVLGLRIIIAGINSVQQAYVSKKMQFQLFFWSTLFGTVVSGVVGVILAYNGYGVWALVTQYLTNTTIDTIVLFITINWRPTFKCSLLRAKALFAYGWKMLASGLLNTIYNEVMNLFIGKMYTMEDLAFYNHGDKYPSLIANNIDASINAVLFPAMSMHQSNIDRVRNITRRSIQVSSFIMWPMMMGLAVCAEPIVKLLLTDKWLPTVPYIRIFCIIYGLYPIHTANLQAISAIGRSDIFLKLEVIKKIYGIIILLVSVGFGPYIMALSLIPQSIISTFVNAKPNTKLLNYKYKDQLKDILPSFIIALIMCLIISQISRLGLSDIKTLLIQVPLGIIIYLFLSIITKQEAFYYLLNSLKDERKHG